MALLLLSVSIISLHAMEESQDFFTVFADNLASRKQHPQRHEKEAANIIQEIDPADLDEVFCNQVFSSAPEEIQQEINHLQDPQLGKYDLYRHLMLLEGPPGSGKSSLAKAIGKRLGIPIYLVPAGLVGNEYQNSGVQQLRGIIDYVIKSDKGVSTAAAQFNQGKDKRAVLPTKLLIFEEMDALTRDHKHEKNEGPKVAKQFCTELDRMESYHPEIFSILITNYLKKMPKELKDRLLGLRVNMPYPSDTVKTNIIEYMLEEHGAQTINKYANVAPDPQYGYWWGVPWVINHTKGKSLRFIKEVVRKAVLSTVDHRRIVHAGYFQDALTQLQKEEEEMGINEDELSEQERLQKERMAFDQAESEKSRTQNKQQHDQQTLLQIAANRWGMNRNSQTYYAEAKQYLTLEQWKNSRAIEERHL